MHVAARPGTAGQHEAGRLLGRAERGAVVVLHGDVAGQQQAFAGAALTGAAAVRKRHPALEGGIQDGRLDGLDREGPLSDGQLRPSSIYTNGGQRSRTCKGLRWTEGRSGGWSN